MELSLASLLAVFTIIEAVHGNAVFSIDLGCTVCFNLLVAGLACYFHNSSFEVFLVMGLFGVSPVIASVAINFTDYLDNGMVWVWVWVRIRSRWWWRFVIVWG